MLSEREQPLSAAPGPAVGCPVPSSRAAHPWRFISQQQPGKRQSANKWLASSVTAALCVLGFPGMASAAATSGALQLMVSPKVSAADAPLTIRVSGLQPGAKVTLAVTSVDAAGTLWSSSNTYSASSTGTVDPTTSPSQANPAAGVGSAVDPMGSVDLMSAPALSTSDVSPIWPFGLVSPLGFVSAASAMPFYWWAKCSLSGRPRKFVDARGLC